MARSPTGTFTLVAGNPVITGTIITSDWANTTMPDIGAALTDSLSRTGQGGMLAPIRGIDGIVTSPAHSFTNFPRSGTYAIGTDETRMSVNGVDRMRWRAAGQPTQTYDSAAGEWRDLGGGGTVWRYEPTIPTTVLAGIGYVTAGGQSTLLPANPLSGEAVSFADLNNDWDETPFTLDGNGNTFSQDGSSTYELNLKGAYAHFAFINNEWVIVNFGRLSDAYGLDLDSFLQKDEPIPDGLVVEDSLDADLKAKMPDVVTDDGVTRVVKYGDGRMDIDMRYAYSAGTATTRNLIVTLPVPYVGAAPIVQVTPQSNFGNSNGYAFSPAQSLTTVSVRLVRAAAGASGTSYVAISTKGRWK